jgi:hypothetical protein
MKTLTRRALPVPTEHIEQAAVVAGADDLTGKWPELRLLFACPNFAGHMGGNVARLRAGAKAKREGRKAGVPDLVLPVARKGYHGLFIEMKRQRGGAVSPEQREWLNALRAENYRAVVCKGAAAAILELTDYLGAA